MGNIASKGGVSYTVYGANHKHAVTTLSNDNTYSYDANGNMITRHVGIQNFNLAYDAENRLVSVTSAATANFVYDGDGKQIKATVNGIWQNLTCPPWRALCPRSLDDRGLCLRNRYGGHGAYETCQVSRATPVFIARSLET